MSIFEIWLETQGMDKKESFTLADMEESFISGIRHCIKLKPEIDEYMKREWGVVCK